MRPRPHIVRSVSLDTELALWVEEKAAGENRSVSNFVNTLLARLRARAGAAPPGLRAARPAPAVPPAGSASVRKPARAPSGAAVDQEPEARSQ
jgi:hypothetical protein